MEKKRNLWVIPTDKPSRLHYYNHIDLLGLSKEYLKWKQGRNIYITSDEKFKDGDWVMSLYTDTPQKISKSDFLDEEYYKKIILTTDQDLIKDGVRAIDDEFIEWFVDNPSCESVIIHTLVHKNHFGFDKHKITYKIIIPKEEPKQETLEEAAREYYRRGQLGFEKAADTEIAFLRGAKWQQERIYSEEDSQKAFQAGVKHNQWSLSCPNFKQWFEQFKK